MENSEFNTWIQENQSTVEELLDSIRKYKKNLKERVQSICKGINLAKYNEQGISIKYWLFDPPKLDLSSAFGFDIKLMENLSTQLEVNLSPQGWIISFYHWPAHKGKSQQILSWLNQHQVNIPESRKPFLGFDAKTQDVVGKVVALLDQIADAIKSD
jgi:hypothetical protein